MKPLAHHSQAGRSTFIASINGAGSVLAFMVTFLATPPTYSATVYWVQDFTAQHYGAGYEDLIAVAWGVMCGAFIFFLSRATIATALTMGGLAIATRFL